MPHRERYGDSGSEVPDGFEFLNDASPITSEAPAARSTGGHRLLPTVVFLAVVATVVLVATLTVWAQQSAPNTGPPAPASSAGSSTPSAPLSTPHPSPTPTSRGGAASKTLDELDVKGRAPTTGYEREQFGPDWADVDGNGCDTRNDVLGRDLTGIRADQDDSCIVDSGALVDPYSGDDIAFTRGWETSFEVQIDHVVALSNAWQTGAQYWKPRKRLAFANDPLNLLAVDGELNLQKRDGDAATWLPPSKPYRCDYVARQIAVKAKYGLWLTAPEHDAMTRILSGCPDQALPVPSYR